MIEYIIPQSPDDRILRRAKDIISGGGLVVLPSDTNWIILADPLNKKAVEKLYKVKGEERSHHFSLLVSSISMASDVAIIPDYAFKLIRGKVPGHYTFIFPATKKMVRALKASKTDHQVGLRIVPDLVISNLLEQFQGPLLSTNIGAGLLGRSLEEGPLYSYEIEERLQGKVDMIIDPGEYDMTGRSTIYDFTEEAPQLVREGAGPLLF